MGRFLELPDGVPEPLDRIPELQDQIRELPGQPGPGAPGERPTFDDTSIRSNRTKSYHDNPEGIR